MVNFIFDGVEYFHNKLNNNVFYKSKYMGKYQEKNGDKIKFLSPDEYLFHHHLIENTNKIMIEGKSLLNMKNNESNPSNNTILSFIQKN